MALTLDISTLFQQAFGAAAPPFEIQRPGNTQSAFANTLGSPMYAADANGRYYFLPVKLGGVQLSYPIVRISGRKTIVETQMVARRGSVKELINIEDYSISIMGLLVGKNQWPEDGIAQLRDLYERNESLDIENALTDIFLSVPGTGGKDKVVITSLDIPEVRGSETVVGYRIELLSDQELILTIA